MNRRKFLMLPAAAVAPEVPDTPRNRVCLAANTFQEQFRAWAEKMNATNRPGILPADAVEACAPLPGLWRKFEHCWNDWLKGAR